MDIELIIPLYAVPNDGKVRKIAGEVEYTIKKEIKIYADAESAKGLSSQSITGQGVVFLVGERGSINAYPDTKKVVWVAEEWEILNFLEKRREEISG